MNQFISDDCPFFDVIGDMRKMIVKFLLLFKSNIFQK